MYRLCVEPQKNKMLVGSTPSVFGFSPPNKAATFSQHTLYGGEGEREKNGRKQE
jgi:hypothetical protein